ncbi:MAG: YeeE/YedE family protein [Proteobacteria bacterium]|nr:YeeE/YedE family protein [Pseudomonadota bacterium]
MRLLQALAGLGSGLLFGAGLAVGGMTDPAKVLAFLDLGRAWDPSLAFVMIGALALAAPAFALTRRTHKPLLAVAFAPAAAGGVDRTLLVGAAVFGVGWGLSGYCPGPALASLSRPSWGLVAFLAAMVAGLLASARVARMLSGREDG